MIARIVIFCALIALSACVSPLRQTPTTAPVEPTPTLPAPASAWNQLAPGLETRFYNPYPENDISQLIALRIDPAQYVFRVHYRPGEPLTAEEWRAALPGAVAFINANFFTPEHLVLGLLVMDGTVYGQSFYDLGGIFQVQNGQVRVRSNIVEPYLGEPLEQAVQAYPMLVYNGAQAYTNPRRDRLARRTAIGQDAQGMIVWLATPFLGLTLLDLSGYLPATDLGLVNAFNLDGGGSTMMVIQPPGANPYTLPAFDAVPAVLAIYARGS